MANVPDLIEAQKARLLQIVDAELHKLIKLSEAEMLIDRDGRAMLETLARLLKMLQGDLVEKDVGTAGYLSPTAIEKALGPTSP